jgi:predicted ArsR family transcriptional regulator
VGTGGSRSPGSDSAALALQRQARALGDPTRHQLFQYVAGSTRPVGIAELTAHLGLSHHTVRQHVAKLVDAELLVEETAPAGGRGRPRLLYRPSPTAEGRWGVTGPYERLSWWLAEVVRTGDSPREVGRRVGRSVGTAADPDPVAAMTTEMARHGFDPESERDGDHPTLVLHACPFPTAVLADPEVVCELHLGLAEGIAEAIGGVRVDRLVPRDPRRAGCELHCRLDAPGCEPSDG